MDELRTALNLATDQELHHITHLLFTPRFNPLDYWQSSSPSAVRSQPRASQIDSIEQRFRFLAADGMTVLRQRADTVSYRQILFQVGNFLKIPFDSELATPDIEAEIFLVLTTQSFSKLTKLEQQKLINKIQRSLSKTDLPEALPVNLQHNPFKLFLKGSGTVMMSSIAKSVVRRQVAKQLALHLVTRQTVNISTAKTSSLFLTGAALRYGVTKKIVGVVIPALWSWFLLDLGWRAIATNYSRIIPMIMTLAQIRLVRSPAYESALVD